MIAVRAQDEGPVLPPEFAALLATTFALSCSTLLVLGSVLKLLVVIGQDMMYKHYSIGQLARAAPPSAALHRCCRAAGGGRVGVVCWLSG